jgi:hypothetical protein
MTISRICSFYIALIARYSINNSNCATRSGSSTVREICMFLTSISHLYWTLSVKFSILCFVSTPCRKMFALLFSLKEYLIWGSLLCAVPSAGISNSLGMLYQVPPRRWKQGRSMDAPISTSGAVGNACTILVWTPERKILFGRPRYWWVDATRNKPKKGKGWIFLDSSWWEMDLVKNSLKW